MIPDLGIIARQFREIPKVLVPPLYGGNNVRGDFVSFFSPLYLRMIGVSMDADIN